MSGTEFSRNFGAILQKAGDKAEMVVRLAALELQGAMIDRSPVDSGRFRSNWQCGIGNANRSIADQPGSDAKGRTYLALQGSKIGQTIWLTNSLPYARRLEYGWSKQAPSGMVRLTVQAYAESIKRAVQQVKSA